MSRGYLLDTSIVSSLYPGRPEASSPSVGWLRDRQHLTYLSSISVFEIMQGVEKLTRAGGRTRAAAYEAWLDSLVTDYEDRLLLLDIASAKAAGSLSDAATAAGQHPGVADVMIAAVAKAHDLLLLSRNVRHFKPLGIPVADPFVQLPD